MSAEEKITESADKRVEIKGGRMKGEQKGGKTDKDQMSI